MLLDFVSNKTLPSTTKIGDYPDQVQIIFYQPNILFFNIHKLFHTADP